MVICSFLVGHVPTSNKISNFRLVIYLNHCICFFSYFLALLTQTRLGIERVLRFEFELRNVFFLKNCVFTGIKFLFLIFSFLTWLSLAIIIFKAKLNIDFGLFYAEKLSEPTIFLGCCSFSDTIILSNEGPLSALQLIFFITPGDRLLQVFMSNGIYYTFSNFNCNFWLNFCTQEVTILIGRENWSKLMCFRIIQVYEHLLLWTVDSLELESQ